MGMSKDEFTRRQIEEEPESLKARLDGLFNIVTMQGYRIKELERRVAAAETHISTLRARVRLAPVDELHEASRA